MDLLNCLNILKITQLYNNTGKTRYNFTCCLYGCETWSVTLREEHRLRTFETEVLRKILGRKRKEAGIGG
jgi:hypothetical protein